jgi:hypothetical protein
MNYPIYNADGRQKASARSLIETSTMFPFSLQQCVLITCLSSSSVKLCKPACGLLLVKRIYEFFWLDIISSFHRGRDLGTVGRRSDSGNSDILISDSQKN